MTKTWEIAEQADGSAVIMHEGVAIGTLEVKSLREQPVTLSYAGPEDQRPFGMFQSREYVAKGRFVNYGDSGGLGATVLSSSIASGGAVHEQVDDLDEASSKALTYDEAMAWYEVQRAEEVGVLTPDQAKEV